MNTLTAAARIGGAATVVLVSLGGAACSSSTASSPQLRNGASLPSIPIARCGVTISTPGTYTVTGNLRGDGSSDCVSIAASGVNLRIAAGVAIRGPGGPKASGTGIHVQGGVNGVAVVFGDGTAIEGFAVGIEIDGAGVSILGSTGVEGTTIESNAAQGILVNGGSAVLLSSFVSQNNGAAGVELSHASGVTVQGGAPISDANGSYGLWIHSSNTNQIFALESYGNGSDGMLIGGETSNQPPSSHNVVYDSFSIQNHGSGIAIALNDDYNVVTQSQSFDNSSTDALDENTSCANNQWVGNMFGTSYPTCVK